MRCLVLRALALAVIFSSAEAATRNVFFAGGQSNAKAVWAAAIAGNNPDITNGAALVDDLRLTVLELEYPAGTLILLR